jgi:hypothetical protein
VAEWCRPFACATSTYGRSCASIALISWRAAAGAALPAPQTSRLSQARVRLARRVSSLARHEGAAPARGSRDPVWIQRLGAPLWSQAGTRRPVLPQASPRSKPGSHGAGLGTECAPGSTSVYSVIIGAALDLARQRRAKLRKPQWPSCKVDQVRTQVPVYAAAVFVSEPSTRSDLRRSMRSDP